MKNLSVDPTTPPHQEGLGASFPLTGEALRSETRAFLKETIWAPEETKQQRAATFDHEWPRRWEHLADRTSFQTEPEESPFSKYSSQGWKVHIAFELGKEEVVSRFLYVNGLHFKTQARAGTWFNGNKESGSTIYIGGHQAMEAVSDHLGHLQPWLTDGPTYPQPVNGQVIKLGSGSDVEIRPNILARFDVQKSSYGLNQGNSKYAEDGLPSWTNAYGILSALPLLSEDIPTVKQLRDQMRSGQLSRAQALPAFREVQQRAQHELVQDFGHDFVLGYGVIGLGAVGVNASGAL